MAHLEALSNGTAARKKINLPHKYVRYLDISNSIMFINVPFAKQAEYKDASTVIIRVTLSVSAIVRSVSQLKNK